MYRSPIVRMRQMFDLYVCLRPCKAYPGNPLNYKENIDLVIFRENTEDLYSGVEFNPVPAELRRMLAGLSKPFAAFKDVPAADLALSAKIVSRAGSERILRAAFEFARKQQAPQGDCDPQSQRGARHRGHVPRNRPAGAQGLP